MQQTALHPSFGMLVVGETLNFTLTAFRPDGSSHPLATAEFSVVDEGGQPTAAATVTSDGLVTALQAANVRVRASVAGSFLPPREAPLRIYPSAPTPGRRVVVVDHATGAPLPGAKVLGCATNGVGSECANPVELTTDPDGVAWFPTLTETWVTISAGSEELTTDNVSRYGRLSVGPTQATDLLLPLPYNSVRSTAGFTGSVSFAEVQSSGAYWAGLAVLSSQDLPTADLRTLLGDTFFVEVPGVGQRLPVPGSLVLFTSPGFGIAQEVKGRSYGLGEAGRRAGVAFAGRGDLNAALTVRATDLLSYVGAFDYAIHPPLSVPALPRVPDVSDVDGDRLCSLTSQCPAGEEDLPDYARLPSLTVRPKLSQQRRTEVVVPPLPPPLDSVVVASVQVDRELGVLPLGFSSRAAALPLADGTRPVEPLVLRSGAPYAGVEATLPGIWAFGVQTGSNGAITGRVTRHPVLPLQVALPPFLPVPTGGVYATGGRVFAPGQPSWNALHAAGAGMGRVTLAGDEGTHDVYFPLQAAQTQVFVPPGPVLSWGDPANEVGATLRVVAYTTSGGTSADEVFSLPGTNLRNLVLALDAYSRYE